MTIKNYTVTVSKNTLISPDVSLLEFTIPDFDKIPIPGQFYMVEVNSEKDPFLRRPYSICEITNDSIKILVKVVGRGSELISKKKEDETLEILGPLGNGFDIPLHTHPILIAGGIGIAPLWFLAKMLEQDSKDFSIIFGERTATPLGEMIEKTFGENVFHVTDDGTRGTQSTASDGLPLFLEKRSMKNVTLFSCGPKEMLKQLILFGKENNIPIYVSLEERMACGIGVCLGCSIKRSDKKGFLTVCKDGPVFNGNEVIL